MKAKGYLLLNLIIKWLNLGFLLITRKCPHTMTYLRVSILENLKALTRCP